MVRMKGFMKFIGAAFLLLSFMLSPVMAYDSEALLDHEAGIPLMAENLWFQLPLVSFGFEFVTEGTNNLVLERQLRGSIPFDTDITLLYALGFTGDKVNIKITDGGDAGDRMVAVALAYGPNDMTPYWSTLYSAGSQNSFEISVAVTGNEMFIVLFSGFMLPTLDETEPYGYTITLSYPQ